jgi:E3 ubiquitin-protein ligase UBR7
MISLRPLVSFIDFLFHEFATYFFPAILGICLACSLQCHEKHELVELYTKRNFHCDCGIKSGTKCLLDPMKREQTTGNKYNQNFVGLYCQCHRPYPDAENLENDEMIQCVICEDWLHSLRPCGMKNTKSPPSESYGEMVCGGCMTKHDFLSDFSGLSVVGVEAENPNDSTLLDVSSLNGSAVAAPSKDETPAKRIKLSDDACTRPKLGNPTYVKGTPIFWKTALWRNELCKCTACTQIYKDSGVEFLTDIEDTVQMYEDRGKGNEKPTAYDASMEALSTLPRVNQIDAISSYNTMKDKLFEYLQVTSTLEIISRTHSKFAFHFRLLLSITKL